jgi:ferritin-like metal-binding protein YciE
MNKTIATLHDALAYQLRGLLYAERKISEEISTFRHHISSAEVNTVLQNYADNAGNVTLKLDRIFSYLMIEPVARKNEIIDKMIDETRHLLTYTSTPHLKDILMIACIKNINAYKTASLLTADLIAVELELDAATDLIEEILEWELTTGRELVALSIFEFNNMNDSAKTK